jgi:hypothetical protein
MEIPNKIWNNDGNYATTDGIMCCWRKVYILPISWEADINNQVGSGSLANRDKTISNEQCQELRGLVRSLIVRSRETNQNNASCLQDSLLLAETTKEEQETLRTKEGEQQFEIGV